MTLYITTAIIDSMPASCLLTVPASGMQVPFTIPWFIAEIPKKATDIITMQQTFVTAARFVAMNLVFSGNHTAMNRSTEIKTTIQEEQTFEARVQRRNILQPASLKARMSLPKSSCANKVLMARVNSTIVSDIARAIKYMLYDVVLKALLLNTNTVKEFPVTPIRRSAGTIILEVVASHGNGFLLAVTLRDENISSVVEVYTLV